MAIFKTSTAAAIIIPIIIMGGLTGLFSGCGYFQAPKAKMDVTPLHVGIQSEDAVEWKKCQVILNESAGEQAYRYQLGNVKPGAHEMVFLSQFAQKDG
ncbi:MAG: hypothetical protein VKJ04_04735, partial [Vampirovibrionales bacterium]|nr:hypothetical protein [Vampirovibrionales bacterium]